MTVFSDDGSAIQYNEFEGIAISSEHHTGILNHRCKKKHFLRFLFRARFYTFFLFYQRFFYFLKTFIENTYDCCILLIV